MIQLLYQLAIMTKIFILKLCDKSFNAPMFPERSTHHELIYHVSYSSLTQDPLKECHEDQVTFDWEENGGT